MGVITDQADSEGEYHPYIWRNDVNNKTFLFSDEGVQTPLMINDARSFRAMMRKVTRGQIESAGERVFSASQVRILGIWNIMIKIFRTDVAMGCPDLNIPEYMSRSRHVNTITNIKGKMCFWACLALHYGADRQRYVKQAKQLYEQFYHVKPDKSYEGIHIQTDLAKIEKHFSVAINVCTYDGEFVKQIRRSIVANTAKTQLTLLAHENHLMYVRDIQQLAKSFKCHTCDMVFNSGFRLNEHAAKCTARVKETFSKYGELYRPADNIIILGIPNSQFGWGLPH